jgi:predicted trehalose synthase
MAMTSVAVEELHE